MSKKLVLDGLMDIYRSAAPKQMLLSSEDFEFLKPEVVAEAFQFAAIRVIVYVRRQDRYLVSEYDQHVRMFETQYSGSLEEFWYENELAARFDFMELLGPWIDVFGRDSIDVRSFDRAVALSGLFADFMLALGIDWDESLIVPNDAATNRSLGSAANRVLRHLNKRHLDRELRGRLIRLLRQWSLSSEAREFDERAVPGSLSSAMVHYADANRRLGNLYPEVIEEGGLPTNIEDFDIRQRPDNPDEPPLEELITRLLVWSLEQPLPLTSDPIMTPAGSNRQTHDSRTSDH